MGSCGEFYSSLLCAVVSWVVAVQQVDAQPRLLVRSYLSKVGNVPVANVLQRLGAKFERGSTAKDLDRYSGHFDRTDSNRDGKHTRAEFVEKGGYLTPQARAAELRGSGVFFDQPAYHVDNLWSKKTPDPRSAPLPNYLRNGLLGPLYATRKLN